MSETTEGTATEEAAKTTETETVKETVESKESTGGNEPEVFDREYVEKLRNEAADWRTKLRDKEAKLEKATAQLEDIEKSKMSESDRLKLEWEQAKEESKTVQVKLKESYLESAVAKNTKKFELEDADATLKLLDANSVEYDESGRPTNIETVLEATLEKYPFLKSAPVKKQAPDTGSTNPSRPNKTQALSKESIARMTHEERSARMSEIEAWAQNGYK